MAIPVARRVRICYFAGDEVTEYKVMLDDEALAGLIVAADKLQEETQDRAEE